MEKTLPELISSARRHWRIVFAITASVLAGATFYAERQPKQYDATAIVAISPRPAAPNPDLVRIAAPKYVSFITAPRTVRQVAAQLGQDPADLQQRVKATVATDTGNISITVRESRPDRAAAAANALAARVERRSRTDMLVSGDLISTADPPMWPSAPATRLIEASALFVGLMLGIAVATLANRPRARKGRARSSVSDMPGTPLMDRYPVVGNLPWSKQLASGSSAVLSDAAIAAAGETLRANVARELGGQVRGLIVVTSPPGRQGKTLVANLLSTVLVRSGERVLLVGTHWEHPSISHEPRNGDGLTRLLQREGLGGDGVQLGWVKSLWALEEGLWVLPIRQYPETGVLPAGRLAKLLEQACEMFDVVVVDSPSVVASEIARTLTWLAVGVLLVVSSAEAEQPMSEPRERLLQSLSAPFVGVVLNRPDSGEEQPATPALPDGRPQWGGAR